MNLITKQDTSRRRIAAVGMYDGVHLGHRFLLDYLGVEARSRGLTPAVVTFSRHPLSVVRPMEAPGLLTSLEDRVTLLDKAGAEDVILLSFTDSLRHMSAEEFLKMLRKKYAIDALVLGFNNRFGHDHPAGLEQYRAIGAAVGVDIVQAPEYRGEAAPISSSSIRRLLAEGKTEEAAKALGSHYAIRGKVVAGKHLGRTLGFPTANVEPVTPESLVPKAGVYAAWVTTPDGERRPSVVNIGYRPTVDDSDPDKCRLTIEAHVIDYQGYIYDEEIKIEFVRRLRSERKFASTAKLASQVKEDVEDAREILK